MNAGRMFGNVFFCFLCQQFTKITSQFGDFKKWINCVMLVEYASGSAPRKTGGSRAAMTLCHLAALNNAKDIMRILLKNGGDLSKQFVGESLKIFL